jgi:hypothetical protein
MAKQTLIIVHGMGDPKDFKQEVIDSLNSGLKLYDAYKKEKIEQLVDIVYYNYDPVFNDYRKKMADSAKPFADRLAFLRDKGQSPIEGDFLTWEKDIDSDTFFRTHWLDVLFYCYTFLAEPIRIGLAAKIVQAVDDKGSHNVHILGHSLGTSVVHDTLESLYKKYEGHDRKKNLDPSTHRLGSVHLVANVSNLLESFCKVERSLVRPPDGCTNAYYQYRHAVDPITWPSPFDPIDNGFWTSASIADEVQYRALRPTAVLDLNTHAITHYLRDPVCHGPLLQMLQFELTHAEIMSAAEIYNDDLLQGKAEMLRDKWKALGVDRFEGIPALIKAAQALRDMLANFGKTFKE